MAAAPRLLFQVGHELTWSVAAAYRFVNWIGVAAQVYGLTPLVTATRDDTADVLGGLQFFPGTGLSLSVAGGANLFTSALRHDDFRVFLGLAWTRASTRVRSHADSDGDGIPDDVDNAHKSPRTATASRTTTAAPSSITTETASPTPTTSAPTSPRTATDSRTATAAPSSITTGTASPTSPIAVPNEPEDRDGFQDDDGCPDLDNDGDGIADARDHCPNEPETFNGIDDAGRLPRLRRQSRRADPIDLRECWSSTRARHSLSSRRGAAGADRRAAARQPARAPRPRRRSRRRGRAQGQGRGAVVAGTRRGRARGAHPSRRRCLAPAGGWIWRPARLDPAHTPAAAARRTAASNSSWWRSDADRHDRASHAG